MDVSSVDRMCLHSTSYTHDQTYARTGFQEFSTLLTTSITITTKYLFIFIKKKNDVEIQHESNIEEMFF